MCLGRRRCPRVFVVVLAHDRRMSHPSSSWERRYADAAASTVSTYRSRRPSERSYRYMHTSRRVRFFETDIRVSSQRRSVASSGLGRRFAFPPSSPRFVIDKFQIPRSARRLTPHSAYTRTRDCYCFSLFVDYSERRRVSAHSSLARLESRSAGFASVVRRFSNFSIDESAARPGTRHILKNTTRAPAKYASEMNGEREGERRSCSNFIRPSFDLVSDSSLLPNRSRHLFESCPMRIHQTPIAINRSQFNGT